MPVELADRLAASAGAWGCWDEADPAMQALYATWVARPRLRRRRRARAEKTVAWACERLLEDHVSHVSDSPWAWVADAVFAFILGGEAQRVGQPAYAVSTTSPST